MTSLARSLARRSAGMPASPLDLDDWASFFNFGGGFGLPWATPQQTLGGQPAELIDGSFEGYVHGAYKSNGIVFACMLVRLLLFSEARFQFRRRTNGRPGDMFGSAALSPLEVPWPNGTTGDLLTRAIQDVDLAGNFYAARRPGAFRRLRPDWVTIIMGSKTGSEIDTEVVGYAYKPGGPAGPEPHEMLLVENVAHWAPIPDPIARFRGMSWLTPVLREIMADGAATTHKLKFFENGATVNMVVSLDPAITPEGFAQWVDKFDDAHVGHLKAYKTLYLGGGADAKPVGADMKQLDFKNTQGAGETRIAAAAGVPPVIVGLSEGLSAATYSNYSQARRRLADGTMRPLWRGIAGALAPLITLPQSAELWYDDRDIPFLQEDQKDAAEIQQVQATTIKTLIDAGFEADSVNTAVDSGDLTLLKHTGLFSVQLQAPGTTFPPGTQPPTPPAPAA